MNASREPNPDPSLLPSPFGPDQLWATCLVDTRFGGQTEPLVLCDPDTGLERLQQDYANPASTHSLVMAFSLSHMRYLRQAIEADAADAELVDAKALGVSRTWPEWMSTRPTAFIALVNIEGQARSIWVRASARVEVHAALDKLYPGLQVMGVGSLGEFQDLVNRLERVCSDQDFGAIARDLRASVDRPATQAHITAYPLAALGFFSSPAHAMATHQAMFIEDEAELANEH